jgi:hypothetical protein
MAENNSTPRDRIHHALEFDGHITRAAKLRQLIACGISRSTARRLLDHDYDPARETSLRISRGLDISLDWLWLGKLPIYPGMSKHWAAVAGQEKRLALNEGLHLWLVTREYPTI